jgi:hypothetical protein
MGMFGQGLGRLAATAFLGTNEMSRRDDVKRQRAMQDAVIAANREAGGLMSPVPGAMRQMQIGNVEGADITDAFGPAMEQGPSRQRSPQEIAAALADLQGRVPGFNSKPFADLLTAGKRDIRRDETGNYVDFSDPSIVGRAAPKAPDGGYVVQSATGPQVRVAGGYNEAVMQSEAAKTTGQEAAKSGYDLIDVPDGRGGTIKMPRSAYLGMIGQGQAGQPGGLGYTRPPEQQVAATDTAKLEVERNFTRPKAQAALSAMDAKTKIVDDAINRVLGISVDPRTGKPVQGPSMVSGWTAGAGSVLAGIPGSPAKDLQAAIETIKANIGFDELQTMRDNSPTGGALGQVAVQELEALRSTLSSLDQAQSPEQVVASLKRIQEIRRGAAQRRQEAFQSTYSSPSRGYQGGSANPATSGQGWTIRQVQ